MDRTRLEHLLARRAPIVVVGLGVLFTLLRLPFRAAVLVNWDAVNFALGLQAFDLLHHQPHPPGYIGYIALGRLVAAVTGDANAALTLVSAVAGGVAPAALYVLATRFMSRRYALVTAALFGTSPLLWYYAEVALTYMLEAALVVPFVWLVREARREGRVGHLIAASVLLAASGAIRQTTAALLLPLWLWAAFGFGWRVRSAAAATVAVATLPWLLPLVRAAGGVRRYLELSSELARLAGGRTWLLSGNLVGIAQNVLFVVAGLLVGLNVALFVVWAARRRGIRPVRDLDVDDRRFFLLWAVPALFTFLLVHTGQLGYVLLVLPIGSLWVGRALESVAASPRPIRLPRLIRPRTALSAGGSALLALNVAAFWFLPKAGFAVLGPRDTDDPVAATREQLLVNNARQFDLTENDRYWTRATEFLGQRFDPRTTAVLAVPVSGGGFRHLAYYLPDFQVYGLGLDLDGDFGHLYNASGGRTDYTVSQLDDARRQFTLPPDVERVVTLDRDVARRLGGLDHRVVRSEGVAAVVIEVPTGAVLTFRGANGEWIDIGGVRVSGGTIPASEPRASAPAEIAPIRGILP